MPRRPKIDRNIGTPAEGEIVRLNVYRVDDDGTRFKTTMSIDPASFAFAVALHGGSDAAEDWLKDTAESLWQEDRERRQAALHSGTPYRGDVSISRDVQRRLMEFATSVVSMGAGPNTVPPPTSRRRRRNSSASGDRMSGSLVELMLHEDATLSGKVLSGRFEGRELRDLSLTELLALLSEASALVEKTDESLITAFLDYRFPDWKNAAASGESRSLKDDYDMLGLPMDADLEQVKLAHRRLLMKVHPDVGGTEALATRLNLARDRIVAARATN